MQEDLRLSVGQAFEAMRKFLERNQSRQNGDLAPILSDIATLADSSILDPAAWEEWIECVGEVVHLQT
jgi:hypothetical protein